MSKLSWKKTKDLNEWKADGYLIEQTGDDPLTMVAHTRTPEGLVADKVGAFMADDEHETKTALLKRAKTACEQHRRGQREPEPKAAKLSVAGALDWARGDRRWTAETGQRHTDDGEDLGPVVYAVEPDSDGQWWSQLYTDPVQDIGPPAASLEAAQALCQQHHDTALMWREANPGLWVATSAVLHPSEDYGCLEDDIEQWTPEHCGDPIAGPTTLEQAKQACQEHHRELVMGGAQREAEAEMVQRAKPPLGKPTRELVIRSILHTLTEEELAAAGLAACKADEEAEALEAELTRLKERFAEQRKSLEGQIEAAKTEKREQRRLRLVGEEYRDREVHERLGPEKGDGSPRDVIYTDPETGAELDRRPATRDELQKWLPNVSEQALTEQDAALERIEAPPDSVPFEEADRLDADGPNETPLEWKRFRINDEPGYRAEVPGGEYRVERGPVEDGKGLLRVFWEPAKGPQLELPGEHTLVGDAKKGAKGEAEQHWQSRLRWPGDVECGVLVDAANKYQLMRDRDGDWMAIFVGRLGENAKELGGGDLDEAKEACQDHADAGRWTR